MTSVNEERIIAAEKYIGLHEVRDKEKLTKLLGFDPSETPWCAGFLNAIERQQGRAGTGELTARSYLKYGEAIDSPIRGDIVVFKRGNSSWEGHVAIFIHRRNGNVYVLGGNQDNSVSLKNYPAKDVLGYRRTV